MRKFLKRSGEALFDNRIVNAALRPMGQYPSTNEDDYGHELQFSPINHHDPDELVDINIPNEERQKKLNELVQSLQVKSDLSHSLHQLAELGNTEAIKIKLRHSDVNKLDGDQLSALHYAARYNHLETVEVLLKHFADVNLKGQDDATPLHYAARCRVEVRQGAMQLKGTFKNGLLDGKENSMIKLLYENNADVNAPDKYGQTPLHYAAMTGNLSAAKDLVLTCGAQAHIEDTHKMTPLILAATHGHFEIVNLLLDCPGVDIIHADMSRQTALHRAAKGGHLNIVEILIRQSRALPNSEDFLNGKDSKHKTPLYHAASNGHEKVISMLLDEGADVNAETLSMATPLHAAAGVGNVAILSLFLKHKVHLDVDDLNQRTPLMYAVSGNHTEAITLLLKRGADINHRDMNQSTPLLIAAQNGHSESIQILLKWRADPLALDKLDKSAIYHCAEQGKLEALKVLLDSKLFPLKINAVDCYGWAPLHAAVLKDHVEIMKLLLRYHAFLDIKNEQQDTVLHIAARRGSPSLVQELLPGSRTMLNAENEDLDTPLHIACKWGREDVVRILLEAGAYVTATNSSSSSPLHLAAFRGHLECCKLLLDLGAPTDVFNKEYKTPIMLAVLGGHVHVTRLLMDHGASLSAASTSHMNVLELAIDAGLTEIALAIVGSPGWEEGMRRFSKDSRGYRVTPFRKMIEKLPKVAEKVLDRCIKTSPPTNEGESPDQTITFEYLDDTYQSDVRGVDYFDEEGKLAPGATRYTNSNRMIKKNHPLSLMIKHKLPSLLSHPVCVTLIRHKWTSYGRWVYYSNFTLYLIFLISLTTYVISTKDLNWIDANLTDAKEEYRNAADCNEIDWDDWKVYLILTVCKWTVVVSAGVQLFKESTQLIQSRFSYLGLENFLEWVCYVCAVLFVHDAHSCPFKEDWQWQVGATSIFLAWINLLLFIRVFPFFGIYVIMFTEVLKSFSSFFLLFFFFIVAFALSFYTVLSDNHGFRSPSMSLLRTAVMMIGEINFEENFNNPSDPLEYPEITFILLIGFCIFMSILIMNLLVGLAVDDIKAVQEQAMLQKLAMQTEMVLDIEMVIPSCMKQKHILKEMKVNRSRNHGVLRTILNRLTYHQNKETSETEELRREVKQLKQSMNKLMEMTSSMKEVALDSLHKRREISSEIRQVKSTSLNKEQTSTPPVNVVDSNILPDGIDF